MVASLIFENKRKIVNGERKTNCTLESERLERVYIWIRKGKGQKRMMMEKSEGKMKRKRK